MNRRRFLLQSAVGVATLAGLGVPNVRPVWAQAAPTSSKPNIVVMIADDLSYHDLGCWGNSDVKTPNLDTLARQGMKLTRCYTPASVCAPTRQALYTGLFPVKSGAYPNHSVVKAGTQSLPHYLKPLGYRVGLVGKTHFGPAASFTFEYPEHADGGQPPTNEDAELALDYDAAERFMGRDKSQPYCLVIAPHEPHSPWNQGDATAYDPAKLTLKPYMVDTPATRRALARYYGEVSFLDRQVGRVMQAIERSGGAKNTLFLFLSEQGSSMPFGKWTLYDVGIRSATIARWPGHIQAGSQSDALCQYVDMLPTFIEMAKGKPLKGIDGRSILPILTGQSNVARDYVFAQATSRGINNGPEAYGIRAVADKRWKYIRNLNSDSDFSCAGMRVGQIYPSWQRKAANDAFAKTQVERYRHRPAVELYDLQNDPFELHNLAAEPKNKPTLARLGAQLDAWMKEQGDAGVKTEMEALEHQSPGRLRRRNRRGTETATED